MKITKLNIRNWLGIEAFVRSELGKYNRLIGGNGSGKSSVMKAIRAVFESVGKDPDSIRIGADAAEILIELDNGVTVERKITQTANTAKVVVDGERISSPQKFLSELLGAYNFNPVEFFLAKPKERRKMLLSAIDFKVNEDGLKAALGDHDIPCDLSELDYEKHGLEVLETLQKTIYDQRTEVGRDKTRLEKAIEQDKLDMPDTFDAEKWAGFDLTKRAEELSQARVAIQQCEDRSWRLENMRTESKQIDAEIKSLTEKRDRLIVEGKALAESLDAFTRPDIESIQADIDGYQGAQKLQIKQEAIEDKEVQLAETITDHGSLERLYKALTGPVQQQILASMEFPIENLEIKGDSIYVDKKSIDKLCGKEQIDFSVSVAKAVLGDLKVICVDQFESLDKESKEHFAEITADDGVEYFMAEVTGGELEMESTD